MPLFSMFVETPPLVQPVTMTYQEKRAFGPWGRAAGEPILDSGFSETLWLGIAEIQPQKFRTLRVVCNGFLRVIGTQAGFPSGDPLSPLVVELVPGPREMRELTRLCAAARIETPKQIIYHGVDPTSLISNIDIYFMLKKTCRLYDLHVTELMDVDFELLKADFLAGNIQIPIVEAGLNVGHALGNVSDKNLASGFFKFGIEIRTTPPLIDHPSSTDPVLTRNYLDPVVLFNMLASATLSDNTPAIDPAQIANCWLENVTRNRILITFRDEWNTALVSSFEAIIEEPGTTQKVVMPLVQQQYGTIVAPAGWSQYACQVSVPPARKLTPHTSKASATENVKLTLSHPAHQVVGSVNPDDWFHSTDPPIAPHISLSGERYEFGLATYNHNSHVESLIDGFAYFGQLVREIQEASNPNHFIILLGWRVAIDFNLVKGATGTSLRDLLTAANNKGVPILAMFWDQTGSSINTEEVAFIDSLSNGRAVLDAEHSTAGSHHIKCAIVHNSRGTVAFLGGIDLYSNRLDGPKHLPTDTKYHDIQCRVLGPAINDVVKTFIDRWMSYHYIDANHLLDSLDKFFDIDAVAPELAPVKPLSQTPPSATHFVQIAQTYGSGFLPFANENRTIWATIKKAIRRAQRYIYIEDQYMVAPMLRDELLTAINNMPPKHIVLVIPEVAHDFRVFADQEGYDRARYLFLKELMKNQNVSVMYVRDADYFIHSKLIIIDDVFASIGSANVNRRSLTHDNELTAFTLDGQIEEGARKFARDLRIQLWAEHLRLPPTDPRLSNLAGALNLMRNPPKSSRLVPYYMKNPGDDYTLGWSLVDPLGP